jgi:ribosome-associated protein
MGSAARLSDGGAELRADPLNAREEYRPGAEGRQAGQASSRPQEARRQLIRITPSIAIDERAITESFVRASGPGGQNVNKVATAVQLRFDPDGSGLPDDVQARLRRLAGKRFILDGTVLIAVQRHRTQERNRQAALAMLVRLIRRAAEPPLQRVATRPTAASRRRRLQTKAHRARIKQTRASPPEQE